MRRSRRDTDAVLAVEPDGDRELVPRGRDVEVAVQVDHQLVRRSQTDRKALKRRGEDTGSRESHDTPNLTGMSRHRDGPLSHWIGLSGSTRRKVIVSST